MILSSLPVRCLRRFAAIGGRDRALAIAGQAFIAFVPLVILVTAIRSSDGSSAVAEQIVDSYHLRGNGADAVRSLFDRGPSESGALTAIGLVVLISSLLSFSRAMQRTYEAAWELPPKGLRGTVTGLTGVGLLLCEVLLLSSLSGLLHPRPAVGGLLYLLRAGLGIPFWLLLQYILLSGRVPWRNLLPGAVVAAVGQTLISIGSKVWIPHVVSHNADRYGVIGVTFALLSWLILLGVAMVAGAAASVEMGSAERFRWAPSGTRHPAAEQADPPELAPEPAPESGGKGDAAAVSAVSSTGRTRPSGR